MNYTKGELGTLLNTLPCGCRIFKMLKGYDVEYCPKHKAAPNLMEANKQTLFVIRQFNELLSRHAKDDEIVGIMDALLDNPIWQEAKAEAEGRE